MNAYASIYLRKFFISQFLLHLVYNLSKRRSTFNKINEKIRVPTFSVFAIQYLSFHFFFQKQNFEILDMIQCDRKSGTTYVCSLSKIYKISGQWL